MARNKLSSASECHVFALPRIFNPQRKRKNHEQKNALLIIDVQNGMFDFEKLPPPHRGLECVKTIKALLDRARAAGAPVIYIQHAGPEGNALEEDTPGFDIHLAIAPRPGETVVRKKTLDAFLRTRLKEELEQRGVDALIVVGLQTDHCVDTTVRSAFAHGYAVTLVRDGHSTWDTDHLSADKIIAHHNAILGDWFCEVKPAAEIEF